MPVHERRNSTARVQVRNKGEGKVIRGTAAVFYDGTPRTEYILWEDEEELVVERIHRGTFSRAIREDDTRALFNHDSNRLLGRRTARTLRMKEAKAGLAYEVDPPDTTTGRDTVESLQRGDVTGSSFSFTVDRDGQDWEKEIRDGKPLFVRNIRAVSNLYDVGPVTYPAYEATTAEAAAEGSRDDIRKSLAEWRAENDKPPEEPEERHDEPEEPEDDQPPEDPPEEEREEEKPPKKKGLSYHKAMTLTQLHVSR